MIKFVTVTNSYGESITLELTRPGKTGFAVLGIEGLTPPKATINTSNLATSDGGVFNSARTDKRNIVITLLFQETATESIEDLRQKSYKYFPQKQNITVKIVTDKREVETEGYVESNEPNIFSEAEGTTISIICPDPMLYSTVTQETVFSGVDPLFEFPFENDSIEEPLLEMGSIVNKQEAVVTYNGDDETGITMHIHALGEASNITIANLRTNKKMELNTDRLMHIIPRLLLETYENSLIGSYAYFNIPIGVQKIHESLYHYNDLNALNLYVDVYDVSSVSKIVINYTVWKFYRWWHDGHTTTSDTSTMEYGYYFTDKEGKVIRSEKDDSPNNSHFLGYGSVPPACYRYTNVTVDVPEGATKIYIQGSRGVDLDYPDYNNQIGDLNKRFYPYDTKAYATSVLVASDAVAKKPLILPGDNITIKSLKRNKNSITLLRDGKTYNILNCLEKNSDWLTLVKGDNIIAYTADVGVSDLQFYIANRVAYYGV